MIELPFCDIYRIQNHIQLLNIDCITYMRRIPDKYFELAIVDPPYGINIAGGKGLGMAA